MDLRLFLAVMGRFKRMVVVGLVLTGVLGVLAYGTPTLSHGKPTLVRRGTYTYESDAQLIVTQAGFPYGRAVQQYTTAQGGIPSTAVGDEGYMAALAPVYVAVANGDGVQNAILGPDAFKLHETVVATEVVDQATGQDLPLVDVTATAPNGATAVRLSRETTQYLQKWLSDEQAAAHTEPSQRVLLRVVKSGNPPILTASPKLTTPLLVMMAGFIATIVLALVRENLKPETAARIRGLPSSRLAYAELIAYQAPPRQLPPGAKRVPTTSTGTITSTGVAGRNGHVPSDERTPEDEDLQLGDLVVQERWIPAPEANGAVGSAGEDGHMPESSTDDR